MIPMWVYINTLGFQCVLLTSSESVILLRISVWIKYALKIKSCARWLKMLLKQLGFSKPCHIVFFQDFTHCILNNLRKYGRRNFVIGMTALGDLNAGVKESFRCHGNTSEPDKAHTRHLISKRKYCHFLWQWNYLNILDWFCISLTIDAEIIDRKIERKKSSSW